MWRFVGVFVLAGAMVACGDGPTAPSRSGSGEGGSTASCNDKPPGQQPSGNPAQAPGNSSSNDHDCKVTQNTVVWGT